LATRWRRLLAAVADSILEKFGSGRTTDPKYVSTFYAERSNLSVRMHTRRFTRLTNAFSKKVENHAHSVALFAMYYNFVRIHKTLRTTPAMAAGITSRLWEIGDIVDVLEAWEYIDHE
jgi:hypothetical protein